MARSACNPSATGVDKSSRKRQAARNSKATQPALKAREYKIQDLEHSRRASRAGIGKGREGLCYQRDVGSRRCDSLIDMRDATQKRTLRRWTRWFAGESGRRRRLPAARGTKEPARSLLGTGRWYHRGLCLVGNWGDVARGIRMGGRRTNCSRPCKTIADYETAT